MGLLGYEDDDITSGLLQFGQLASKKRPFLGLLAGLAAADRSQTGRAELARQRDVEERKLKLEEALKTAQIGEYIAQADQRRAEVEKLRRAEEEARRVQGLIGGALSPIRPIEANAASGVAGPRPEALDVVGQRKPLDFQSLYAQGVPSARLEEIAKLSTLGLPTVARTIERDDGKGGKETIQLDAQGNIVGQGIPGYIAPVQVNQGDRMSFVRPNAGVSLPINMSLSERDASARGWASNALARERLDFDKKPGLPTPATGWRWNADGTAQERIPGGPADLKAGDAGQKAEERRLANLAGADNVLDAIADAKKAVGLYTAGAGSMLSSIPGTPARNLAATLETVKANFGFDRLQQMREASPTGGALGQVAVQELVALQSTVASLDQAQSPAQLAARLDKAQRHYENWKKTLGGETTPKVRKFNPETGRIE